jgi:hypothetical protein
MVTGQEHHAVNGPAVSSAKWIPAGRGVRHLSITAAN